MINLKINKILLAIGLVCFIFSGSIYLDTPEPNIDEECEICNYWDYCETAVEGQKGSSNCDDQLNYCHLIGSPCDPDPE